MGGSGASAGDQMSGGALFVAQNAGVIAAPYLQGQAAAMTGNASLDMGLGGAVVLGITALLNATGQWVKQFEWFDQNKWLIPLLALLALGLAVWYWHDDLRKAVLNGALALDTAVKNYGGLSAAGLMKAGTPTAKDAAAAGAQPTGMMG